MYNRRFSVYIGILYIMYATIFYLNLLFIFTFTFYILPYPFFCRASERSPFDGSCCGGGYTNVDSLPPSPSDSEEPPPQPR